MDNPSRRYLYLIGLAAAILYLIAAWHERQEPAPDAAGQTAFWGWKAFVAPGGSAACGCEPD